MLLKHGRTIFIPSVTFSKIQDLSFQYLAIICPAYATDGLVCLTVKQDLAIKLLQYY
jgi:hypothetical protein